VILTQITTHGRIDTTDEQFMEYAKKESGTVESFVKGLLDTRLVAKSGKWISSISDSLVTAVLPTGDFVASNNSELLTRWVSEQRQSK
jgi:hypothetical protein